MRLLLDTHVLIAALKLHLPKAFPGFAEELSRPNTVANVSVASLWEIAIKSRLGKLDVGMPLGRIVPFCREAGFGILAISPKHAIAAVEPEPATRDPFDRLLIAQCVVEGLRLATVDRALRDHPLALPL